MLEQNRIATRRRIEDADVRQPLQRNQKDRDRDNRRAKNHDQARRIVCPHKQGQPEPGHPRRAHRVNRDDEI